MIEIPERFNAASLFVDRHVAAGDGGRTAFRCRGCSVTYAELADRAGRLGRALLRRGVQIEQRVLIALPDGPEFAEACWGAVKIGAVAVLVSDGLAAEEYAFLLADSRARAAVVSEDVAARIAAGRARGPWLRALLVVGRAGRGGVAYERALAREAPALAAADTVRDDVAMWACTSGSTGRPKAAIHLHRDLVTSAELVGRGVFQIAPGDLVFSVSKAYFAFGFGNSLLFPALAGAAALLMPERPEAGRVIELIETERPTVLFTVPTMYSRLLERAAAGPPPDLASIRLCVSSGEHLPPALWSAWKARFGHELLDVVGSTEALHDFIANRPGRARAGSSGEIVPGYEARLVDDDGRLVRDGEVGHLLIKGDSTAAAYWNRRERTRATMQGEWLRTGDMFSRDRDGYFYFCGRSDDMLKVGGRWVAPAEVEACLAEHPDVLEAAVVGGEDGDGLVRPRAFCVLRPGAEAGASLADALRQLVHDRLAGYKAPRWVEFVGELPRTATGKVQRFRLRAAP